MLGHDLTKLAKPHFICLPNRGYVVKSNPVAQNLSLTAGYYVSVLHVNDLEGEMKIWTSYKGIQQGGGSPRIYGEKYYLRATDKEIIDKISIQLGIDSLLEDQKDSYEMTMKNGREVVVEIKRISF